jgi:hypothetical protein
MSRADVMYGVSMQEFGVSKTVGMQFSDEKRDHSPVDPTQRKAAKSGEKRQAEAEVSEAGTPT